MQQSPYMTWTLADMPCGAKPQFSLNISRMVTRKYNMDVWSFNGCEVISLHEQLSSNNENIDQVIDGQWHFDCLYLRQYLGHLSQGNLFWKRLSKGFSGVFLLNHLAKYLKSY